MQGNNLKVLVIIYTIYNTNYTGITFNLSSTGDILKDGQIVYVYPKNTPIPSNLYWYVFYLVRNLQMQHVYNTGVILILRRTVKILNNSRMVNIF